MRKWEVWKTQEGGSVKVYDLSLKNSILQRAFEVYDFADAVLFRHSLCGAGLPEWAWRVPLGRPQRGEDGMLDNSLAGFLYESYSRFSAHVDKAIQEDLIESIPLGEAQVQVLSPSLFEDED